MQTQETEERARYEAFWKAAEERAIGEAWEAAADAARQLATARAGKRDPSFAGCYDHLVIPALGVASGQEPDFRPSRFEVTFTYMVAAAKAVFDVKRAEVQAEKAATPEGQAKRAVERAKQSAQRAEKACSC